MDRSIGTKLLINANEVMGLTSIGGLSLTAETMDKTTLSSTGAYREFMGGFKDGGEVPVSGYFEPSDTNGQNALYNAFESGATTPFQIVFPATMGASWVFNGVVTGFSTSADLEDIIGFEATIKVSGKPTLGFTVSAGLSGLTMSGTGGSLVPTFATGKYYYAFTGVTAPSVTVTATAANHTIWLFVDGAKAADLTSGSPSGAITLAVGTKKFTIMAFEEGKTIKTYEIVVEKAS